MSRSQVVSPAPAAPTRATVTTQPDAPTRPDPLRRPDAPTRTIATTARVRRGAQHARTRLIALVRDRRFLSVSLLALLVFGLVPVFQGNITRPADDYFFNSWDQHSQALVLGKIEQEASGSGTSPFGLIGTAPDSQQAYTDLAALEAGGTPAATAYSPYISSIGLQGHLFSGLYSVGCTTLACLNTAESGLFALGFVLFAAAIWFAVSRSFATVVVVTGLLSPWIVSAAHNLYWVPWTWLLPAAAAALVCRARTRRGLIVGLALVAVSVALKSATGYEYLTTVATLAAAMPLLARAFGRVPSWRRALQLAAALMAASVLGFLLAFLVHAMLLGGGDPVAGTTWILDNAERRTWATDTDADPLVTASHDAGLLAVLNRYAFGWSTSILGFGMGTGGFAIASQGFWVLVLIPSVIAGFLLLRGDARGRRYFVVLLVSGVPPLSWLVLAKSHAFAETNMTYVLWYLPFIAALVWVVVDVVRSSRLVTGLRALGAATSGAARTP